MQGGVRHNFDPRFGRISFQNAETKKCLAATSLTPIYASFSSIDGPVRRLAPAPHGFKWLSINKMEASSLVCLSFRLCFETVLFGLIWFGNGSIPVLPQLD